MTFYFKKFHLEVKNNVLISHWDGLKWILGLATRVILLTDNLYKMF